MRAGDAVALSQTGQRRSRNSVALTGRNSYYKPMHQVKMFKGSESDLGGLEKQINTWLAGENVRVINMSGNIAPQSPPPPDKGALNISAYPPSDVLVIIQYEK